MKTTKDPTDGTKITNSTSKESQENRLKRVRELFGEALNQHLPISQERLAGWCGIGKDVIYHVERGRTRLSEKLADRLYRITGASKGWLFGDEPFDSFKKEMLVLHYPIRLKERPRWDQLERYEEVKALIQLWDDVICPHLRYVRDYEPWAQLLPDEMVADFGESFRLGRRKPSTPENRWMAYAFAKSPEDLRLPLQKKWLDPAIREFTTALPSNPELDLPLLNHLLLVLLSEIERKKRPWPPAH